MTRIKEDAPRPRIRVRSPRTARGQIRGGRGLGETGMYLHHDSVWNEAQDTYKVITTAMFENLADCIDSSRDDRRPQGSLADDGKLDRETEAVLAQGAILSSFGGMGTI